MKPGPTILISLVSGLIFGVGLALSGMTQPAKVVGFLDVTGRWDPSLALVMAGAIGVYMPVLWLARRRGRTVPGGPLLLPTRKDLDRKLVGGAALFGMGWGISGVCPGPGLTSLATGTYDAILFVVAMAAGMLIYGMLEPLRLPGAELGGARPGEDEPGEVSAGQEVGG